MNIFASIFLIMFFQRNFFKVKVQLKELKIFSLDFRIFSHRSLFITTYNTSLRSTEIF